MTLREHIWARDGGTCWLCGGACDPRGWELDHIVPRSAIRHLPEVFPDEAANMDHPLNLAVSHPDCNKGRAQEARMFCAMSPDDPRWEMIVRDWTRAQTLALAREFDAFGYTPLVEERLAPYMPVAA